jgi:hypothetical protein
MSVFSRRYAILGWTVWFLTKQYAKRKARRSLTGDDGARRAIVPAALAASIATAAGVLIFWRRHREQPGSPEGAQ